MIDIKKRKNLTVEQLFYFMETYVSTVLIEIKHQTIRKKYETCKLITNNKCI